MESKQNAKKRIEDLRKYIREHNYRYYVLSSPKISDYNFDMLMKELIDLENKYPEFFDENSPSVRVGDDKNEHFEQINHKYPMLSLSNTYSKEELAEFDNRIRKAIGNEFNYCCELKFDGVSINLTYENGKLIRAVTRGDGTRGDIVTNNVRTIYSIPLVLRGKDFPAFFEIRGEIIMPHKSFLQLNKQRQKQGLNIFANPRNAASGSLKMLNSKEVAKRKLDCFMYYIAGEHLKSDSHFSNMQMAKSWGFKISDDIVKAKNIDEVYSFTKKWEQKRLNLDYDIDGVVVKVDSNKQQKLLGQTSKAPRWSIAYKFKAEKAETQIISVDFQVGRTGTITPVANLKPVKLAGTTVKRSTLHNADYIKAMDLHYKDSVFVEKAGEIIPQVVGVDNSKRLKNAEKIKFPNKCPQCGTNLVRNESEAAYICPNSNGCPPQIKGKIEHFISRKAMDIGAGDATVDLLYKNNLVKNIADLYDLKFEQIIKLDRFAEKSAKNLINSIDESKKVPFNRVLYALGIKYIGESVSKILVKHFKNIDNLINASVDDLTQINEIGLKIAQELKKFFDNKTNLEIINRLKNAGLKFQIQTDEQENSILKDKTFVVSGNFGTPQRRKEIESLIEKFGGKKTSSVSKKTDFLIAGQKAGSSKMKKAEKFNINIISENDFLEMIK